MAQNCDLISWRHHISHLLQTFGGQTSRYGFEILHADYSYVGSYTYNTFFENFKNCRLCSNFSKKKVVFENLGVKIKNENPRKPYCREFNLLRFEAFCLRFTSVFIDLRSIWLTTIFDSKSHDMTSLKRHFLKKSNRILRFFRQRVKLMSDKILKVWCRCLTSFSSYREYSRGGR